MSYSDEGRRNYTDGTSERAGRDDVKENMKCDLFCPKMMPNIGDALCSTPQSVADAHYLTAMQ